MSGMALDYCGSCGLSAHGLSMDGCVGVLRTALAIAAEERDALRERAEKAERLLSTVSPELIAMRETVAEMLHDLAASRAQVEGLLAKFRELADFSPHCCEDCPCDHFRAVAAEALASTESTAGQRLAALERAAEALKEADESNRECFSPRFLAVIHRVRAALAATETP